MSILASVRPINCLPISDGSVALVGIFLDWRKRMIGDIFAFERYYKKLSTTRFLGEPCHKF